MTGAARIAAFLLLSAGAPRWAGPGGQQPPLAIHANGAAAHAVVRVGSVLNDAALEEAIRGGLPIRVQVRVELWHDGFIDNIESTENWTTVLLYEPLEGQYIVRPPRGNALRYPSWAAARESIESEYPMTIAPRKPGQYYYTATLQIETLSSSDLDDLERWLRGELGPAVSGQRSLGDAVGEGAKRLLIKLLGLPTRRVEAKSERFRVG